MIEKIINLLVIAAMVVVANYPIYANLKDTANEVNGIARDIKSEVSKWRSDVNVVKTKLENVRNDIVGTVDAGIAKTNSVIGKTEEVLAKIKQIEADIDGLSTKIENIKIETVNKIETKIETKVEKIKEEPVKTIKDLFKIKG